MPAKLQEVLLAVLSGRLTPAGARKLLDTVDAKTLANWLALHDVPAPADIDPGRLSELVLAFGLPRGPIPPTLSQPLDLDFDPAGGGESHVEDLHPHVPIMAVPDLTTATPTATPGTTLRPPVGAVHHVYVNVKAACYIPYVPNGEEIPNAEGAVPATSISPWYATLGPVQRQMTKAMLATGNVTPPGGFPTRLSWAQYLADNEYRCVFDIDLLVCCDDQGIYHYVYVPRLAGGFTPAPSDARPENLHDFHLRHETLISKLRNTAAPAPAFPSFFDLGEFIGDNGTPNVQQRCITVAPEARFIVNDLENRGFATANAGRPLPWMWFSVIVKLCCDGSLEVSGMGSGVPSKILYVNNVRVDKFDMLGIDGPSFQETIFDFAGQPLCNPANPVTPHLVRAPMYPAPNGTRRVQVQHATTKPTSPDCPDHLPDWIYEGAAPGSTSGHP